MIRIKEAIVVEGRYDKNTLSQIVDAHIIETAGFGIFSDKEKTALLRRLAEKCGIIILTDSDGAGFQIRNHLKSCIGNGKITNIYIPDIFGKEKRKERPSKEGKLGVEGIDAEILRKAFIEAGVMADSKEREPWLTKADLLDDGLTGGEKSAELRKRLSAELSLPERISVNALLEVLNRLYDKERYKNALKKIKGE